MTKSQEKSLNYLIQRIGVHDTYKAKDESLILHHERGIESIGIKGGITTHIHIFNNKYVLNGAYAYK
jgi:hypothetical protein